MKITYLKSEKGQVIIYLTLGLLVFLGFVALAIDGGMVLADRRHAQNAADAASLAGGAEAAYRLQSHPSCEYSTWTCDTAAIEHAENAAVARATANDFNISKADGPIENAVYAVCDSINYPGYEDKFIDVTVELSATTKSNFAHLVFPKALHNEVEAVTRVHPSQPVGFGNAIVALNPNGCSGNSNGIIISGDGTTIVDGSGIFSNGCLKDNGGPTAIITGGIPVGRDLSSINPDNWDPDPLPTDIFITDADLAIPIPDCSDPNANLFTANQLEAAINIDPGLYCVTGNVSFQGSHNTLHGTGVTIVILNGTFTTNGGSDIQLSSLTAVDPAIQGLTLYLPPPNNNTVTLNGNSNSFYSGTVFAPLSTVKMDGTGDVMYQSAQVIGYNVTVGGTADTTVYFDECNAVITPPYIELSK